MRWLVKTNRTEYRVVTYVVEADTYEEAEEAYIEGDHEQVDSTCHNAEELVQSIEKED